MIRLLTATLLVASFSVAADTEVPHTFEDGNPAKASEVNANFDALEAAIDATPVDAIKAVTSADLDMDGNRVLFSNVFSQLADLPSASDNHGMFAHVHETGEAYYAHAGNWIQIAKQSSIDGLSATTLSALTCSTNQIIKYDGSEWVCAAMPADGAKGDTGEKGDTGDKGDAGDQGIQGIQGIQGPAGFNGDPGSDGEQGDTGDQGPAGADGVAAGLTCSTNQIIKWNGSAWACATDPFASLSCSAGDTLTYDGSAFTCSCVPPGTAITDSNFHAAITDWFAKGGASQYGDITKWCTGAVTNMLGAFNNRESFNEDISAWDTSKVETMAEMFSAATAFNQNIGGWDTSKVTNMRYMFTYATNFNQNIAGWDTSSVTNMISVFTSAYAFNQDIGGWDTSSVTIMLQMFFQAEAFNQNLSSWNVAFVTECSDFKYGAYMFDSADLPNFTNCTP